MNSKTDRNLQAKTVDHLLVRNLQEHDETLIRAERERKRAMQAELRDTLVEQIRDRDDRALTQNLTRRDVELRIVDDGFGANRGRGGENFDQRSDVQVQSTLRENSATRNRDNDRQIVQALSE